MMGVIICNDKKSTSVYNEILRIVSNEYNNGNIPHANSTPLNSEKEIFIYESNRNSS